MHLRGEFLNVAPTLDFFVLLVPYAEDTHRLIGGARIRRPEADELFRQPGARAASLTRTP